MRIPEISARLKGFNQILICLPTTINGHYMINPINNFVYFIFVSDIYHVLDAHCSCKCSMQKFCYIYILLQIEYCFSEVHFLRENMPKKHYIICEKLQILTCTNSCISNSHHWSYVTIEDNYIFIDWFNHVFCSNLNQFKVIWSIVWTMLFLLYLAGHDHWVQVAIHIIGS